RAPVRRHSFESALASRDRQPVAVAQKRVQRVLREILRCEVGTEGVRDVRRRDQNRLLVNEAEPDDAMHGLAAAELKAACDFGRWFRHFLPEHLRGQRDATALHVLVDTERALNKMLLDLRRCHKGALALHDHQPALVGEVAYGLASGRSADAELPTELDL